MIKILSNTRIYDISTGIMYVILSDGLLSIEPINSDETYYVPDSEEVRTLWSYLMEIGI